MESLKEIDCNCNDCKFMIRNSEKREHYKKLDTEQQMLEFERKKEKAFQDANALIDEKQKASMLFKANKMKFQYEQRNTIHYGFCSKFNNKEIPFIPMVCELETQDCWEGR